MATDLTMTDAADGQRALAWKALNLLSSPIEVAASELGDTAAAAIAAAITLTEYELRAVPDGGAGRQEWSGAIDERLRKLGAKVLPTAGEAANAWREAMVEALCDLPAMVALSAARKAIHRPFRFIGEVETAIREIAGEMIDRRRGRLLRLDQMRRAIERALNPPHPLLGEADPEADLTLEQIRALTPELRAMGLRGGFITQGQVDAALGDIGHAEDDATNDRDLATA